MSFILDRVESNGVSIFYEEIEIQLAEIQCKRSDHFEVRSHQFSESSRNKHMHSKKMNFKLTSASEVGRFYICLCLNACQKTDVILTENQICVGYQQLSSLISNWNMFIELLRSLMYNTIVKRSDFPPILKYNRNG